MVSPAEVIAACLVKGTLVIVPTPGGPVPVPGMGLPTLFIGSEADDCDVAVILYDVGGRFFGRLQRTGQTLVHPGVNLLVRHLDYPRGYALAQELANFFDAFAAQTVMVGSETVQIQSAYRIGSIISLGEQIGKRRNEFSLNIRVAFQGTQSQIG